MTHKIFVIGERQDQGAFNSGMEPERFMQREFSTSKEADCYRKALFGAAGLIEHRLQELEPKIVIAVWGRVTKTTTKTFAYKTEGEKNAVLQGLEDGDGYVEPLVIDDKQSLDYLTMEFLVEHKRMPDEEEIECLGEPSAPSLKC